jgi:hypothetical protein
VNLVAVVAAANVTLDTNQLGVVDVQAGLFTELSDQGVFRRFTKVNSATG